MHAGVLLLVIPFLMLLDSDQSPAIQILERYIRPNFRFQNPGSFLVFGQWVMFR